MTCVPQRVDCDVRRVITVGFATQVSEAAHTLSREVKEELDCRRGTQAAEAACNVDLWAEALTVAYRIVCGRTRGQQK